MHNLTPSLAQFTLEWSLQALEREHPVTLRVIEAIPADKSGYSPDTIARSAIDLAWHIVMAERRFMHAVAEGAFNLAPTPRPDNVKTPSDVARWSAASFEHDAGALRAMTADQLVKVVDFRGLFQLPAVAYVQFVTHHTIHHRGQLSTYLRPMGAKVPTIYGESFDTAQARQAPPR